MNGVCFVSELEVTKILLFFNDLKVTTKSWSLFSPQPGQEKMAHR